MRLGLSARIEEEDITLLAAVDETVVVQHLSLHRSDGGEGEGVAMTAGDFFTAAATSDS